MNSTKHFIYFAIFYFLIIFILSKVFHQNPSSDRQIYIFLIEHWVPFNEEMLTTFGQYPPLLPTILKLLSLTGLANFEFGLNYLLSLYLLISIFVLRKRLTNREQYVILTVGLPISAIWAQDETLSIPILIYFMRYTKKSDIMKSMETGIAMISLKIFFLFFVIQLVMSNIKNKLFKELGLTTLFMSCITFIYINNIIQSGYDPNNDFAFGLFSILTKLNIMNYSLQNKVSIILFVSFSCILFIYYYVHSTFEISKAGKLFYSFMLLFLLTNAHVNPEYLIFLVIPALLTNENLRSSLLVYVAAWLQNVMNYAYRNTDHIEFLIIDVFLCIVGFCIMSYSMYKCLVKN